MSYQVDLQFESLHSALYLLMSINGLGVLVVRLSPRCILLEWEDLLVLLEHLLANYFVRLELVLLWLELLDDATHLTQNASHLNGPGHDSTKELS